MNLKPKETQAILAGHFPEIVRPEKPEPQEIVLKSLKVGRGESVAQVSLAILGASKTKTGAWKWEYRVKDDRGLYPAQGLGYTRSPQRALDPTAPILDPDTIEQYASEAVQKSALLQAEHWKQQETEKTEARAGRGLQAELAAERARRRDVER